jgi:hypothetical protein
MKAGELTRVAKSFVPFMPSPWRLKGKEFLRRRSSWVQIIGFNPSRFADQYTPRSSFEFLKMPGEALGTFLGQELKYPNGAQHWVKVGESPNDVFAQMAEQFRPGILEPLQIEEIRVLLEASLSYWPHAYALCVMSMEDGDRAGAQRYFEAFLVATANRPYQWVETRKNELTELYETMDDPSVSRARLANIEAEKLRVLKL